MQIVLFSKLLTTTDLGKSLSIPTTSLGLLLLEEGHLEMNLNVHDDSGQEWIFPCSIQRNEDMEHVLSIGWLGFANHRDIRVGDKVSLLVETALKDQATAARIKIEVERKIRLFGKDIWAGVMYLLLE
ncbi:hypothetical protein P3X46_013310 [Hevea brasiliensis]|uniref:TF-B3 domain-containing protein n=1 Tax=Hevea brasiliensis TaxID=3981 RepID=A0ABQ9M353_HEVBR|nr:hypothetical protein P3X46_013310 [Hevea brasiliensis]